MIGIVDFRNIVKALNDTHGIDMSNFALVSLKRRMEKAILAFGCRSADDFINKIQTDQNFLGIFLHLISVHETEMFRDPSLWRELRDHLLGKVKTRDQAIIWLPCATSGQELYTVMVILRELNANDKFKVIVTSISQRNIDFMSKGVYDLKPLEAYEANYTRYNPNGNFNDYYKVSGKKFVMDESLLENVEFIKHNIFSDTPPKNVNLVIYRNKMIYFNQNLQNKAISKIDQTLLPGGYFVIGVKEVFDGTGAKGKYILFSKNESIYKKLKS
ncbi:MAG: hypothetical protein C0594_13035 [Marinilabiliales bacterium]|nr:MAG: hypothetical protein C0594_13035 [Marinilabiliales bacterium]